MTKEPSMGNKCLHLPTSTRESRDLMSIDGVKQCETSEARQALGEAMQLWPETNMPSRIRIFDRAHIREYEYSRVWKVANTNIQYI